jgi:hypothetical protein
MIFDEDGIDLKGGNLIDRENPDQLFIKSKRPKFT